MKWQQITMIVYLALSLAVGMIVNGQPKTGKHSFVDVFITVDHISYDVKDFKDKNLYKGKEIRVSFGNVVVAIWLICYVSISMIFTTGLLIYHIKIIKYDKTTREELKKLFVNPFLNPYERSTKRNLKNILLPNIKRTSIIDELKDNKIKYLKSIEE